MPRIDISQVTGFSPATVTSVTAGLIAKGLIYETSSDQPVANAKRGRPKVNLKVRGKAHLVVGIKLTDTSATVSILDFDGKQIANFKNARHSAIQPLSQAVDFLEQTLLLALANVGLSLSDISGIGVGLPGVIDAVSGRVHWTPTIHERDIPLAEILRKKFGVVIFLDNDANLVTIAEQRYGLGINTLNFVVITVEQGVGMGIIIEGKIYRGANGCGAELGHTKVQLDGVLCRCGQRGCLEAYVGNYALLREAKTKLQLIDGLSSEDQVEALFREARSGNEQVQEIIRRAGRMFAMGLANVINIFSPELVILSGERMKYDYFYDQAVIEDMKKSVVLAGGPPPDVRVHDWDDNMWAVGAAAFAIDGVTDIALGEMN